MPPLLPIIKITEFINDFIDRHKHETERPFSFILGAGASVDSKVPAGYELAKRWLQEMYEMAHRNIDPKPKLEDWATARNTGIKGFVFDRFVEFYPDIYQKRFERCPGVGHSQIEALINEATPSYGYGVLAHLLATTNHRIVITTNFDNLVADAVTLHTNTFPRVIGHDSLANYAQADSRRPMIIKVHGDIGFVMRNARLDVDDGEKVWQNNWQTGLHDILRHTTPVIIGYDGNDKTLMNVLTDFKEWATPGLYWCVYYEKGTDPRTRIAAQGDDVKDLVTKHGHFVPHSGFDSLMFLLNRAAQKDLNSPDLYDDLRRRHREREEAFDERVHELTKEHFPPKQPGQPIKPATNLTDAKSAASESSDTDLADDESAALQKAAMASGNQRAVKPWWHWEVLAADEPDPDKKDAIYQEGLKACPQSNELLGNYANFLNNIRKDYDQAEKHYQKALELEPKHAIVLGNYAIFLKDIRKDYDQAEKHFQRALKLDPNHVNILGSYANFLSNIRKEYDQAEEYYRRALEIDPKHANNLCNYAVFLSDIRKEYDQADEYFQSALELEPKHAGIIVNYVVFLRDIRKEYDQAEEYYQQALELDPEQTSLLSSYANFLSNIRKEYDQAEEYYRRALEIDPKHANSLGNYANFLKDIRKEYDQAEEYYRRALEINPKHANSLGNYANFLKDIRKDYDQAEKHYQRALELEPKLANNLGNYYEFLLEQQRYSEAKALIDDAWRRGTENFPECLPQLALAQWLVRLCLKETTDNWLRLIKYYLDKGIIEPDFDWISISMAAKQSIPKTKHALIDAICAAYIDEAALPALQEIPEWVKLKPSSPEKLWPE